MKCFHFLSVLILSVAVIENNGLKILGILPFGTKSHWSVGHTIIKTLVDQGHEATVLTAYPLETPIRNYNEIDITSVKVVFKQDDKMNAFLIHKMPNFLQMPFLYDMGMKLVKQVMEHPNVQKLIESDEKFDVCFFEIFHADSLTGLFDHFGCIYIPYTTGPFVNWLDHVTSNLSPTSYVVSPMLPYSEKMNFLQRWYNTFYVLLEDIFYYSYFLPSHRALYSKYFPNAKQTLDEMIRSPGIVFSNSHVSIAGSRPSLPNTIEIAGVQIAQKKKLPEEMQKMLDFSADGAILFSMGSVVHTKDFPNHIREAFIRAFGKIKQNVIWKYENETIPNKPDNLMISPWVPQRDILAHHNIKLFITHGGYLSTVESVAEGVPILGLPMFGDQYTNIAGAVYQERGLSLEFEDLTEEIIIDTINELISNPKYSENAKIVKKRFLDRPFTPQQAVIYWTEHAVRNKGAKYLRSTGSDLNFIQFYSLDVYFSMLLLIFLIIYIEFILCRKIYRKIFAKNVKKIKKQ